MTMLKYFDMLCLLLGITILVTVPLYAAMSNNSAKANAQSLWGPPGDIVSYPTDNTVGSRQVGVWSKGCVKDFTPLGLGSTSWEQAFKDYNAKLNTGAMKILGPFSGRVLFEIPFWDNVAVAGIQLWIDSQPFGAEGIPPNPIGQYDAHITIDTTLLTNGVHVACARARDTSGNYGSSSALLFRVMH